MSLICKSLTPISDIVQEKIKPDLIKVAGWVRTKRSSKKLSFIELNDGTCAKSIQIIAENTLDNYPEVDKILTGYSLEVSGKLVESPGKGQKYEIQATEIKILGPVDPETYPLQKKEMTFEYLREVAHLRMRTATFSSMFRLRSKVSYFVHQFFQEHQFSYLTSPIITANDCEGAGETFQVTTFDLNKVPKNKSSQVDFSQDFFGKNSMLTVSGQLEGELFISALNKIYTFGPTFRAENSNTSRHLAEFWMIEPEMAFATLEDNMELAQAFIRYVVKRTLEECDDDLNVLSLKSGVQSKEYLPLALEKDFVRITYTEAIDILLKSGVSFEYPVYWGCDLKSQHERFLCETYFKSPTILYNYPEELKAFYMYLNEDNKTVRAMDVLMPGIGEVIGGSQREDREKILIERMTKKNIPIEHMDWYLATRRYGSVPHSGFGLGFERLLMWLSGFENIRDVIPFPRTPGNCEY